MTSIPQTNPPTVGDLTRSILMKWRDQQTIRFMDGDTLNCTRKNLKFIPLKDASNHIYDWKVDWDMNLTPQEIALVHNPQWRQAFGFAPPANDTKTTTATGTTKTSNRKSKEKVKKTK